MKAGESWRFEIPSSSLGFLPALHQKALLPSSPFVFSPSVLGVRIRVRSPSAMPMENSCKCRACGREFEPEHRNKGRQAFCARQGCQRVRRTLGQRLRRRGAGPGPTAGGPASDKQEGPRRLQEASVISEAAFRSEHPVIIGLISMLIGTDEADRVEAAYRQLWMRGMRITSGNTSTTSPNSQIISMFEGLSGGANGSQ
jgi:hypothetical protein